MIPLSKNIEARLGDEFCIVRNFLSNGSVQVIWRGGEIFTCQLGDLTLDLFNLSELFDALDNQLYLSLLRDMGKSEYCVQIQEIINKTSLIIIPTLKTMGLTEKQIVLILEYVKKQKTVQSYQKIVLLCLDLIDLYRKMRD